MSDTVVVYYERDLCKVASEVIMSDGFTRDMLDVRIDLLDIG